jgi:hypothetical protein
MQVPPPKALADLITATEAKYGSFPRRNAAGERIYGADARFDDSEDACAFTGGHSARASSGRADRPLR